MSSCLCLGPSQSGKTHLLMSVQSPGTITSVSTSVPTIGTNIFTIKLPTPTKTTTVTSTASTATCNKQKKAAAAAAASAKGVRSKNAEINILEIGGSMAPMWTSYLENVSRIIYVVDTSNLCQISAAGVLLYSLLADPRLRHTRILLVLTKMDLAYRQMRNEALLMLQIEKLKKEINQSITIIETDAISCSGHEKIIDWLRMP